MLNNYLENDYRNFIATSRYARWIESENRRETWSETVSRFILHVVAPKTDKDTASEIEQAILGCEIAPSMRALMTAGPALDRDNTCAYNCFSGDTSFITDEGLTTFTESVGKNVKVLARDGVFRFAEVKSFGKQSVNKVVFRHSRKSNLTTTVIVTPNHRWYVNGEEFATTKLKVGDKVFSNSKADDFEFIEEAWVAGFGFGDGTIGSRGNAQVRLCGSKADKFLHHFESVGHASICYPPSSGGDPTIIFHKGFFSDWKSLPYHMTNNIAWMNSWFMGYFAADGHHSPKQPGISSQDVEAIEFVQKFGPMCGFMVTGRSQEVNMETNFGTRKSPLIKLTVRDEGTFIVDSIEPYGEEEVYCVVEPITQGFTLANGMLTGNCAYLTVDDPKAFDEAMFILLCGTGVGFSVERQYISKLPDIPEKMFKGDEVIVVKDSKEGWAKAFRKLIALLYAGEIPSWDMSKVRPAGAKLKTFGGRASGPAPLIDLFNFTVNLFVNAKGRKLSSLEAHDLLCKVGEVVVVGGVRRSAMISLSNLSDDRMRHAKSGQWWEKYPHRSLANNSVAYTEKPDMETFMREWLSLVESKSGERGVANRVAADRQVGKSGRRKTGFAWGFNPCGEVILRPNQFCNLTSVIIRATDTLEDLSRKVRLAAILGTIQSTYTHFPYLRKIWKDNTEEERLLGVSLTGIMDHKHLSGKEPGFGDTWTLEETLSSLKQIAISTNKEWADKFGIPQSTGVTVVKPEGTVSQLVDSSSGIHARHSPYYIRTVRGDNKDPLTQFMKAQGIPNEPDVMRPETTTVFSFPQKSPEGAITRNDMTALEQLEIWLIYQRHWCEHNPSVTITVRDHEWLEVGAWVYKHFDEVSGVSFLPHSDHSYQQAPYQECSKREYEEALELMPKKIDWTKLSEYEFEDTSKGTGTFSCTGNSCEIVDLV